MKTSTRIDSSPTALSSLDNALAAFNFPENMKEKAKRELYEIIGQKDVLFIDAPRLRKAFSSFITLNQSVKKGRRKTNNTLNKIVREVAATETEADFFISSAHETWPAQLFDATKGHGIFNDTARILYTDIFTFTLHKKGRNGGIVVFDPNFSRVKDKPFTPEIVAALGQTAKFSEAISLLAHEITHIDQPPINTTITDEDLRKLNLTPDNYEIEDREKSFKNDIVIALIQGKEKKQEAAADITAAKAIMAVTGNLNYLKAITYFRVIEALEYGTIRHATFEKLSVFINKLDYKFPIIKIAGNDLQLFKAVQEAHKTLGKVGKANFIKARKKVKLSSSRRLLKTGQRSSAFLGGLHWHGDKISEKKRPLPKQLQELKL